MRSAERRKVIALRTSVSEEFDRSDPNGLR